MNPFDASATEKSSPPLMLTCTLANLAWAELSDTDQESVLRWIGRRLRSAGLASVCAVNSRATTRCLISRAQRQQHQEEEGEGEGPGRAERAAEALPRRRATRRGRPRPTTSGRCLRVLDLAA